MGLSMRRCLLLISLLLAVASARAGEWLVRLDGRQQFAVNITMRGIQLSGICIVKTDEEGSRGAIVNEFGFHALDFTISADRRKVKLLNVLPQMDRWYVKRVVRGDLKHLFSATEAGRQKGRRVVSVDDEGTVTLKNERYKLTYSLKKIEDETGE